MKTSLDKKPARTLTAADRCDRCSARALVETALRFAALVRVPLRLLRGRAERRRCHHPGGRAAPVADRLSARHGGHVAALSALSGAITSVRRTDSPLSSEPVDRSYECFDEAVAAMTRVVKDDEFAVRPLLV
jgi:hypothetical protein